MILKLFDNRALYYDTDCHFFYCIKQDCSECPLNDRTQDDISCNIKARDRVIDLLINNIERLIKLC